MNENTELIFVVGSNTSGKTTFIQTRLNELSNFEIIMAEAYKGRTKEVFIDGENIFQWPCMG